MPLLLMNEFSKMNEVYERFCDQNDEFKQLVTDWQVKIVDGEQQMNDHSDADYDAAIFARLGELDAAVAPVFADAASLAPRLDRYIERYKAPEIGDSAAFVRKVRSYIGAKLTQPA